MRVLLRTLGGGLTRYLIALERARLNLDCSNPAHRQIIVLTLWCKTVFSQQFLITNLAPGREQFLLLNARPPGIKQRLIRLNHRDDAARRVLRQGQRRGGNRLCPRPATDEGAAQCREKAHGVGLFWLRRLLLHRNHSGAAKRGPLRAGIGEKFGFLWALEWLFEHFHALGS